MELAEPTIPQGFEACVRQGARMVIVHPYFLSPGRHSTSDIPRMVAEAAKRFPDVEYRVTQPLGLHPKIGEVVLERAGIPFSVRIG
jgi:sirohydrochlorin ferrochelatase